MSNPPELPPLPSIVHGRVRHRREQQRDYAFEHRLALWLVDVDQLPHYGALASFRVADHLGDPNRTLRENVLSYLRSQGEERPVGRIAMLASARVAGYVFDPLTVFWCFTPNSEVLCVVAEVHNTYGQRAAYLLYLDETARSQTAKTFYVSPFFSVDGKYALHIELSSEQVEVDITLYRGQDETRVFTASFSGVPERATRGALLRTSVFYPFMPQRVSALIRWHGIRLYLSRLPLIKRPERDHEVAIDGPRDMPWDAISAPPSRLRALGRSLLARRAVEHASRIAGVQISQVRSSGHADARALTRGRGPLGIVVTPAAFRRLATEPKIGLADGFVAGEWMPADGTDLADLLTAYASQFTKLLPGWMWRLRRITDTNLLSETRNDRSGSKANISAHYDLSNDLFALFLDPTMSYSSALFDEGDDLESAQLRKLDAVLDLAQVTAGSRVLEIGTGWGSLALRAAHRGAHVTTITLSQEQADEARRRIESAGLAHLVEVRIQDYRDVEGTFDAVISIEMIEAVGEEFWPTYVRCLEAALEPGGRAVVQAITMPHERFLNTRRSHGWIQEYIFPGGLIPSVQALGEVTAEHTRMAMRSSRQFGLDYAHTLRAWRRAFLDHSDQVQDLGFSGNFIRLWQLYLAYCEAGFASGYLDVEHLVFVRPPVD